MQDRKYLGMAQLCARWGGVSSMTIERRLRDDPTFPRPSRFSPNGKGPRKWALDQIEDYERAAAARPPPALKPLRSRSGAARAPDSPET
jgi:hypothetical protein